MIASFRLDEVRLTDKEFAARRQLAKSYVRGFDLQRLMHTFKINAGLPSEAKPLGGWEAPECGLRGHFVGHYLSACAKFAYGDNDEELTKKAEEIVDVMTQCARMNGYLSAFEEEILDVLEAEENRNVWAPYYTLHKILQGLIDCRVYLGNAKALELAVNLAHYIRSRFNKLSDWKIDGILRCTKVNPANEFGGIGDSLYTLYDLTGDKQLLELGRKFDREYWIGQLAEGRDVLENLHANTHLPLVLAAMHRYRIEGEERYRRGSINFYEFVKGRTFANGNSSSRATACTAGGVSEKAEHWGAYGRLEDALTGGESESCCAHNTERIIERLLNLSDEVGYLEHLETLKYNAILNGASARTGLYQYHQPMGRQASKTFSDQYDSFWCCTASGIEAMSELQKNIWFRQENGVLLNAFVSSTVTWEDKGIAISQRTEFPDHLASELIVEADRPVELRIAFRDSAVRSARLNGRPVALRKRFDGYVELERVFRDGDRIDIEIAASLRLVPLQGSGVLSALMYGNVLLARVGDDTPLRDINERNVNERIKARSREGKLEWFAEDEWGREARFIPLYRVEEESYSVYMDWTGCAAPAPLYSYASDGSSAYGKAEH